MTEIYKGLIPAHQQCPFIKKCPDSKYCKRDESINKPYECLYAKNYYIGSTINLTCPLCRKNSLKIFISDGSGSVFKCKNCNNKIEIIVK